MTAQIGELIDNPARDASEIIRDEIATILKVESANQEQLAGAAGKNPQQWKLRVFVERSNPWHEFQQAPDSSGVLGEDPSPIVNVAVDQLSFDMSKSDIVERMHNTVTYNIDCYGYGKSASDNKGGHTPGDYLSSTEALRAARLVRRILMAGHYTYLGQPRETRFVWRRWVQAVQIFQPAIDGRTVQHVVGARMQFQVECNEFSPQVQGETLTMISSSVKRAETGEVLIEGDFTP